MKRIVIEICSKNENLVRDVLMKGAADLARTYGGSLIMHEETINEVPSGRQGRGGLKVPAFVLRESGERMGVLHR